MFAGTADAVRQYMWLFEEAVADGVEDFLILSGDHLYRCNYQDFVREHRETGADITVAALPCDPERASAFGLMKIDDTGKIGSFAEKPTGDALKAMEVDTTVLGLDADKAKVCIHCVMPSGCGTMSPGAPLHRSGSAPFILGVSPDALSRWLSLAGPTPPSPPRF